MQVRLVQSGGFAGLRIERVVDADQLPPGDREQLGEAFARAGFFALPDRRVSGMPDVIQYRLSAEIEGRRHEIVFDDETADGGLCDLVDRIVRLADRNEPPQEPRARDR